MVAAAEEKGLVVVGGVLRRENALLLHIDPRFWLCFAFLVVLVHEWLPYPKLDTDYLIKITIA